MKIKSMGFLLCLMIPFKGAVGEVNEPPPFTFSALLDEPPRRSGSERIVSSSESSSGFRVGSFAGITFGSAASYLSPRISSLDVGSFPIFGLSLSLRLGIDEIDGLLRRFELSLNSALGFGRTFERGAYDNALDVHFRPMVTFHLLESLNWGIAVSGGLNLIAFDSEDDEISQVGLGSYLAPRITWHMNTYAQLYIELGWSSLYDFLAYSFREPTEEEILDNPSIQEIKEKGDWFNHYQLLGGLRLLGF